MPIKLITFVLMRLFVLILIFASGFSSAQNAELVLNGTYQNKNIYIQNPYSSDKINFCTEKIIVNGTEIKFEQASAYEINLKNLNLKLDDSVKVIIKHKADCKPKVLHQMHDYTARKLNIIKHEFLGEGTFRFATTAESGKTSYSIEQFWCNKWIKILDFDGTNKDTNHYEFKLKLHSGENKIRVKQLSLPNKYNVSGSFSVKSNSPVVEVEEAGSMAKTIKLSSETYCELYSKNGEALLKGFQSVIDCSKYKGEEFYLLYDNKDRRIVFR